MAYYGEEAKKMYIEVDADDETTVRLKIQETRNADIAPTWRTIRVLTEKDLPFKGELELNPASRFIKITPASVSGTSERTSAESPTSPPTTMLLSNTSTCRASASTARPPVSTSVVRATVSKK